MQDATPQQQTDMLGLSIVVPCFNEEPGLAELVRRCCESASSAVGDSFELILVDDGSSDGTWDVITSQIAGHPQYRRHQALPKLRASDRVDGRAVCCSRQGRFCHRRRFAGSAGTAERYAREDEGKRGRRRLRATTDARRGNLVQDIRSQAVLPNSRAIDGRVDSGRCRGFQADVQTDRRYHRADARARPLHPGNGRLGRFQAGRVSLRPAATLCRIDQISARQDDSLRDRCVSRLLHGAASAVFHCRPRPVAGADWRRGVFDLCVALSGSGAGMDQHHDLGNRGLVLPVGDAQRDRRVCRAHLSEHQEPAAVHHRLRRTQFRGNEDAPNAGKSRSALPGWSRKGAARV